MKNHEEPNLDLATATDDELRLELKRRDAVRAAQTEQLRRARLAKLEELFEPGVTEASDHAMRVIDWLLPDHSRSTCDGSNPNVDRCIRCTVQSAIDERDFERLLRIRILSD